MNGLQRQAAAFGAFDGTVSVAGVIFGLLVHHARPSTIAVAGLGGAIASSVSMAMGEYESNDGSFSRLVRLSTVMGLSTLLGTLAPLWAFFVLTTRAAVAFSALGCFAIATWIGHLKAKGVSGYVSAFVTILVAIGLTLGIVSLIPASV